MTYEELTKKLYSEGFTRVERDDRLLDVFSKETREKGVELWQKWEKKRVKILRMTLPYNESRLQLFAAARSDLERMLYQNETREINNFRVLAEGSQIKSHVSLCVCLTKSKPFLNGFDGALRAPN